MKITKYGAAWCGPCKMLDKIIDSVVAETPEVVVEKIDVDAEPQKAMEQGIMSVPVIVIQHKDGSVFRHVGILTKDRIREKLGL